MAELRVGILGGSSLLGERALPLLADTVCQVSAFTRGELKASSARVVWRDADDWHGVELDAFLSFAPIWVVPSYLERLSASKVRRVVVLSSTSRFIKEQSPDPRERALAQCLIRAEDCVRKWAQERGVEWVILRPTMIYGFGRDKNIAEVARFIRRFGFFPLIGGGVGLRQPVHVDDVVQACMAALNTPCVESGSYNLSGGEVLAYRTMVARIFQAQGIPERMLPLSAGLLSLAISAMRCLPRYRHLSAALVARMSQDLVFDHSRASGHFGFLPRPFHLSDGDLPE